MDIITTIRSKNSEKHIYRDYVLHDFQYKSIKCAERGESVIVSAATGNGKTMIAEAEIDICKNQDKKLSYTAPIKALSNQKLEQFLASDEKDLLAGKYMDLREKYGQKLVGLMTGDRVENPNSPFMVMTTEILANMLFDEPEKLKDLKSIVLDEIHNLGNKDRGWVIEELLINKPNFCNIIGLSGSFPNSDEFCNWMGTLHNEKFNNIVHNQRLIPISFSYYHKDFSSCTHEQLIRKLKADNRSKRPFTTHLDFIKFAKDNNLLNVLGFINSRSRCETYAEELLDSFDFLNVEGKKDVEKILLKYNDKYPLLKQIKAWKLFEKTALNGICFYHSGLVPIMKNACEEILYSGNGKVSLATDAVNQGLNIGFRTCYMENLKDPFTQLPLEGSVFTQRSGRAGRAGFDTKGHVYVLANMESDEVVDLKAIKSEDVKSQLRLPFNRVIKYLNKDLNKDLDKFLESSFANFQYKNELHNLNEHTEEIKKRLVDQTSSITSSINCKEFNDPKCPIVNKEIKKQINSLENELKNCSTDHEKELIINQVKSMKELLYSALNPIKCTSRNPSECMRQYSKITDLKKEIGKTKAETEMTVSQNPVKKLREDFDSKVSLLKSLNFIDENNNLQYKGTLCSNMYSEEILVSQLIEDGLFYNHDVHTINAYLAGVVFEEHKKFKHYYDSFETSSIDSTIEYLNEHIKKFEIDYTPNFNKLICPVIYDWSIGKSLVSITEKCDLFEGDFIDVCKDVIALLTDIKKACSDEKYVISKVDQCIVKLKRDIVSLCY